MKVRIVFIRRLLICVGYSLFIVIQANGQTSSPTNDLKQIVTPSPNASALGQYGNVPVGLYTGSSQISVPLYEIKEGALALPISLSYNSGGFKVADFASWTGLGWTLNAGGAITRTLYEQADELGIVNAPYSVPVNPNRQQQKQQLLRQDVDFQPDIFYFNFNGKAGKFIITQTSVICISPHQNLKIQALTYDGIPIDPPFKELLSAMRFRVTDENGIVYEFKDYETNRTITYDPYATSDPMLNVPGNPLASINAWYLSDMYSPTGDTIRFLYSDYGLSYDMPSSEQRYILAGATGYQNAASTQVSQVQNTTRCQNQNKRLQQILFSNGSIAFNVNQPRVDLIGDSVLNQMTVFKRDGTSLKAYSFQYKYSAYSGYGLVVNNGPPLASADNYYASYLGGTNSSSSMRLMLTGVSELDSNYLADGRNYLFDYDISHGALPSRFSKARDYWGYSNGSTDNDNSFLNYEVVGQDNTIASNYHILGKEPDSNYCGQNILTKITYPTGGYTKMSYEMHDAYLGRGVLPPETKSQTFNMPIDFPSYGGTAYAQNAGYTDTLINGVHCYYKTFLVHTVGAGANPTITISNMMYQGDGKPVMKYDIYDSANQAFLLMWDLLNNSAVQSTYVDINSTTRRYNYALSYYFPNGAYKVIFTPIASFVGNTSYMDTYLAQPNYNISGWSNLIVHTDTVDLSRSIGGLRVKKVVDYDPVSNKYTQKDYSYTLANDIHSSGELLSGVSYIYPLNEIYTYDQAVLGGTLVLTAIYNYIVINSETSYALSTTQGSNVGYSTVTMTETDPVTGMPNGKSEYHYTSPNYYPDYYGPNKGPVNPYPFAPTDSRDWQRGLLLQKIDYQYISGQFVPLRYENNTYSSPVFVDSVNGYITRYQQELFPPTTDTIITAAVQEIFSGQSYQYTSGYMLLLSKSVTNVENGATLTTTENYTYDDVPANMLPTSMTSTDSKGDAIITHLTYPLDYSPSSAGTTQASGIINLQQAHIITPVIEKSVQKKNSSGTNIGVVSGIYMTFKPTQPLVDSVFRLEAAAPITNYTPVNITAGATNMDPHYIPVAAFGAYDGKGNLLQQRKVNDLSQAYLWDYKAKYPIAEVKNALANDIAYTSFEADGSGNWTIPDATRNRLTAITGSISYNLNAGNTITRSGLNSSNSYVVSYWSTGGALNVNGTIAISGTSVGAWTYYEHMVTGVSTVSVSGNATIDELRLFPKGSLMTTYTFAPLVGMTSQCSPTNYITYFTYDGLQRLTFVKDMRGNIVKTIDYHYQGQ